MGTGSVFVDELPSPGAIKVHRRMCGELFKLVNKVSKLFPKLEEARPRCSSGIEALCLLNVAISKAKQLLQYCSESSKLYLALTADAILLRCKKSKNSLEQGLLRMQNMVPVLLAAEISQIIADIRNTTLHIDPSEEEAGEVIKQLLHGYTSATYQDQEATLPAILTIASILQLTSQKAILIEKRSIKKLLDKVEEGNPKRKILLFFLSLLNKHGTSIMEQKENSFMQRQDASRCADFPAVEQGCHQKSEPDMDYFEMPRRASPPEQFLCPLSGKLMYDPVVISSGQTFERIWIQKWFNEGHDTCPKTKRKLAHMLLTPNDSMKDLISKWCKANGILIMDPDQEAAMLQPLENSSTSIASLSSSINDLVLPLDLCNQLLESDLDSSQAKHENALDIESIHSTDDCQRYQSGATASQLDLDFIRKLDSLPWDSQCDVIEDIKSFLKQDYSCMPTSVENFMQPVIKFLKDASDLQDVKALTSGCQLLLAYISRCSNGARYLDDDVCRVLLALLDTRVCGTVLAIVEALSSQQNGRCKIAASGVLESVLGFLDVQNGELQEQAINVLCNFSEDVEIGSWIQTSDLICRLIPFLDDTALSKYALTILKNLCNNEDARVSIVQTVGSIASIAKQLESESNKDQEQAVAILLSLCSQRSQWCELVMEEGVIPVLCFISVNGTSKAKAMAFELLRILRGEVEYIGKSSNTGCNASDNSSEDYKSPKSSPKAGFFRRILFSKNATQRTKCKQ